MHPSLLQHYSYHSHDTKTEKLEHAKKTKHLSTDINAWLTACRLRLNAAKTQLLWLGSSQLVDRVNCHNVLMLGTRVAISDTARDLGAVIDRELSLAAHVTAVCRSGYNQLRQL